MDLERLLRTGKFLKLDSTAHYKCVVGGLAVARALTRIIPKQLHTFTDQKIPKMAAAGAQTDVIGSAGAWVDSGFVFAIGVGHANVNVSGQGSTLDLACPTSGSCVLGGVIVDQGPTAGSGTFATTVANGGRINFSASENGSTGIGAYGQSAVTIDGPGSQVALTGSQTAPSQTTQTGVGVEQGSSLSITNGGILAVTRATAGFNGVLTGGLFADDPSKAPARIPVDGTGSTIDADALFTVGECYLLDTNLNAWVAAGAAARSAAIVGNGAVVKADEIRIGANGTLSGNGGTVEGDVDNAGTLAPGESPGVLNIVGDYVQTSEGIFVVEIGGTGVGEFDVLNVSGKATLGGTLRIELLNGFTPGAGDSFDFLTAALFEGDFADYELPTFGAGRTFAVTLGPQGFTAAVTAVPLPATAWALAAGSALLAGRRRRG